VEEVMRPLNQCRLAPESTSLRETLVHQSRPGRRAGAIMIIDDDGRLAGIFTDSDLARLLEAKRDAAIDGPLRDLMTRSPAAIEAGQPLSAACELLARRKISELPVVDADGKPLGLIDITDVVGVTPDEGVQGSKPKVQSRQSLPFRLHRPET
jgi:arabinose-5-phosphate isomerase